MKNAQKYYFQLLYEIYFLNEKKNCKKIKAMILNKLCSKFEPDIYERS